VGDWISVGGNSGQVVQISWRSVHLRTASRNLLVLPNSALGRETITNYSQPTDQQMLRLSFGFGLDAPPNRVKEMLVGVAQEIPLIMKEPAPHAVTCEVLDDRIRYEARVCIEHGRYMPRVVDQFTSSVWYAARRAGLSLPLPRSEMRDVAADVLDIQKMDETLRGAEGFRVLSEEAVARLAAAADVVSFGVGERLIAAGEVPHNVYVITSGEALGTYPAETGETGSIRFGADEVLGVTSLARAQASDIQVIAATDIAAVRISGDVVARVLQEHPALSNQFARIWQARADVLRRSGQQAVHAADADAEHATHTSVE
jgi:hypothetical protein